MHVIVFSRDRAMQLDATLRSFFLHCEDADRASIIVLFQATNAMHAAQYAELARRDYAVARKVRFVREENFRADLLRELLGFAAPSRSASASRRLARLGAWAGRLTRLFRSAFGNEVVLFLVDDNLFVRGFRLRDVEDALAAHPDAVGVSLRLGRNTTYCYPRDHAQRVPPLVSAGRAVKYDWPGAEGDFGYPLEVSSSAYRLADVFPLLAGTRFRNPNTLEVAMARRAGSFRSAKPALLCFETSVTFCNPVNKVQGEIDNRAGAGAEHSSDSLARLFATGQRIDVESYAAFVPSACHQEVALRFVRS
jgi:hypothetical protein